MNFGPISPQGTSQLSITENKLTGCHVFTTAPKLFTPLPYTETRITSTTSNLQKIRNTTGHITNGQINSLGSNT